MKADPFLLFILLGICAASVYIGYAIDPFRKEIQEQPSVSYQEFRALQQQVADNKAEFFAFQNFAVETLLVHWGKQEVTTDYMHQCKCQSTSVEVK